MLGEPLTKFAGQTPLLLAVGLAGKAVAGTQAFKLPAQSVTVESLVPNDLQSPWPLQQRDDVVAFVSLPFDEQQLDGQAAPIGGGHDLGVAASARLSHGLCGGSAYWIGGALMGHHMRAIYQPDFAAGLACQRREQPVPDAFTREAPIPSIDRFPRPEVSGQIAPRPCIAQPVEQGVHHHHQGRRGPSAPIYSTICMSRFLSGPHHLKRCIFIGASLCLKVSILASDRFPNTA